MPVDYKEYQQVKIFCNDNMRELEKDINSFMKKTNSSCRVSLQVIYGPNSICVYYATVEYYVVEEL